VLYLPLAHFEKLLTHNLKRGSSTLSYNSDHKAPTPLMGWNPDPAQQQLGEDGPPFNRKPHVLALAVCCQFSPLQIPGFLELARGQLRQ